MRDPEQRTGRYKSTCKQAILTLAVAAGGVITSSGQQSTPVVKPQFKPEVARLSAQGLRLAEAVEVSSAGGSYLAAIFEREKPKDHKEAFEFRVIEGRAPEPRTIFRRAEFFFSFASLGDMARLNATDINRDGFAEVIVQSSSGGNCWSCNPTEVYRITPQRAELIAAGPIHKMADLNGDGFVELILADTRWEFYADLSHAASPSARMVYAWRENRYVYASRDFADYYAAELSQLRASLAEAKAEITESDVSDEPYIGLAVTIAITCAHAGDVERGLRELETLLRSPAKTRAQSKRRETIITDFRTGESSVKLRELKYGDPIPLG